MTVVYVQCKDEGGQILKFPANIRKYMSFAMRKGVFGAYRFYPKYPGSAASDLDLHCLLRCVCPKTYGYPAARLSNDYDIRH